MEFIIRTQRTPSVRCLYSLFYILLLYTFFFARSSLLFIYLFAWYDPRSHTALEQLFELRS